MAIHAMRLGRSRRGLRGYRAGLFPVPIYNFRGLGCACGPRRLGDDTIPNVSDPLNPNLLPNYLNLPTSALPTLSQDAPQLAQSLQAGPTVPGVSMSTLLAAAQLPDAPLVVKQAAAQYQAAHPVSAAIAGISTTSWLLGGAGLVLVLVMASAKRR